MIEVKLTFDNPSQVLDFFAAVAKPAAAHNPGVVAEIATSAPAQVAPPAAEKPSKPGKKTAAPATEKAAPTTSTLAEPEGGWTKDHAKTALEKVLDHFTNNPETVDGKPLPALDSLKKWCMSTPNADNPFVSITKVVENNRIGEFIAACNAKAGG